MWLAIASEQTSGSQRGSSVLSVKKVLMLLARLASNSMTTLFVTSSKASGARVTDDVLPACLGGVFSVAAG